MKMSKNKTRQTLFGVFLVLLILLTGTYAFRAFNQGAFGPAWDDETRVGVGAGGRIHDDFELSASDVSGGHGHGVFDKAIYGENFGEEELLVRVRLHEFLQLEGENAIGGAVLNNPSTWPTYQSEPNNARTRRSGTPTAAIGAEGVAWALGDSQAIQASTGNHDLRVSNTGSRGSKVYMPTFNRATDQARDTTGVEFPFNNSDAYLFTDTNGRGVEAITGGFDITDQTNAADIFDNGIQTGAAANSHNGSHNYWSVGETYSSTLIYTRELATGGSHVHELASQADVTHTAQETLAPYHTGVMTMAEWIDAGRPDGNLWILDVDGWFYWNGDLTGATLDGDGHVVETTATSLLLNAVYLPERVEAWDYAIHVDAQWFTRDDFEDRDNTNSELGDMTDEAREIFISTSLRLPAAALGCHPTNMWTDSTGVEWCVVEDHEDYAMLISHHVHRLPAQDGLTENQANANHSVNAFIPWPSTTELAEGPEIRERLNTWFNNSENVSEELRHVTVHATLPNLNDTLGWAEFHNRNADKTAISLPVSGSTNGLPFFMSPADLNMRLGTTEADRQTTFYNRDSSIYWLRSAGNITRTLTVSWVTNFGYFHGTAASANSLT